MDQHRAYIPILKFPIKLDVGAGRYAKDGFVRLDFDPCDGATDIVWDISAAGIPLPNNSVSELWTSHFLEHLTPVDLHFVLGEIFRVCEHSAIATIVVPHADSDAARLPCHYNFWSEATMRSIGEWLKEPDRPDYNGDRWDVLRIWRTEPYNLIGEFRIMKGA